MGLDQELVREAERAKEQLAVSQHAAYRAKVDYHQAIRRLHAAGGSLREIAEALRMSHQRVHQIIDEAAEPTRRRLRREPQLLAGPVEPCSFCGRPRDVCAKLIAGPGVFICDRCVVQATRLGRCGWSRRGHRPSAASAARKAGRCGTWSPAGCRCLRARSASCPGSATGAGTCAWRSWPRPRLPEPGPVDRRPSGLTFPMRGRSMLTRSMLRESHG
jgi:hypothetical protein